MRQVFFIRLPIPVNALRPNARVHWAQKAKATKQQRTEARLVTLNVAKGINLTTAKQIHLKNKWFFKSKARRDMDNFQSSLKAARDGIADALGVNDRIFVIWPCEEAFDKSDPRVEIAVSID